MVYKMIIDSGVYQYRNVLRKAPLEEDMKRISLIVLTLTTILSVSVRAQELWPADFKDVVIDDKAESAHVMVVGNDKNVKMLVLYESIDQLGRISIKSASIDETGDLRAVFTVENDIDASGLWHATWNPELERYHIVYRKNQALISKVIRANAKPKGRGRKIRDYDGTRFYITWATGKRYVVFFSNGNALAAQALRKSGGRYKEEKNLAGGDLTGDAYPVGATTQVDGIAICYFALYSSLEKNFLTLSLLKTNKLLDKLDQFSLADSIEVDDKKDFFAVYDPSKGNHLVAWTFEVVTNGGTVSATPTPRYAVYSGSGVEIMAPTDIPEGRSPINLSYAPVSERFAMTFSWISEESEIPEGGGDPLTFNQTNFAVMLFRPNGSLVSPGNTILEIPKTPVYAAAGSYSLQDERFLLVWTFDYEGDPATNEDDIESVNARLFY